MSSEVKPDLEGWPWTPYVPSDQSPWDLRRVVHLHRRAGFAATWSELQRDLKDGPEKSVDRVLAGKSRIQGVPDEFPAIAGKLTDLAVESGTDWRFQACWIYRMLFGPDPLAERLTLMWHNHFATSNGKVRNLAAMRRQNEILREFARAPFSELLTRAVRDPALLIYLDAQANRKDHPNENLGRELMELFTLGVGHYTESDVKEAARALTGWTVVEGKFHEDAGLHDAGAKRILDHTGRWNGTDLLNMLLEHPATAQRIASRLCQLFLGDGVVERAGIRALASGLRAHQLDVGWAVATILRSELFFASKNLGNRILGPVEYVVGAVRALELFDPPPNTQILAEYIDNLGQSLFYPPNVGGWPGGRSWLSTRAAIGRFNFAVALLEGQPVGRGESMDVLGLAARHGYSRKIQDLVAFCANLLLGHLPSVDWSNRILEALNAAKTNDDRTARSALALMVASPEAQLG